MQFDAPIALSEAQLDALRPLMGPGTCAPTITPASPVAYGKTMYDILRLRGKLWRTIPDAVLYPDTKEQIRQIVAYCQQEKIPVYVYGGGSSVTRGVECMKGGVSLDMRLRFNKVVAFNEVDQTITVEAGMERAQAGETLNDAVRLSAQSGPIPAGTSPELRVFLGGGLGGDPGRRAEQHLLRLHQQTLCWRRSTPPHWHHPHRRLPPQGHRAGSGADHDGRRGAFGVLTHVTLKIFRHTPRPYGAFRLCSGTGRPPRRPRREMMQCEAGPLGVPALGPEETGIMLRLYGGGRNAADEAVQAAGFKEGEMCLYLGFTNGEKGFSKLRTGDAPGGQTVRRHEPDRLCDQGLGKGAGSATFMRDTIQDFGLVTDTMECSVNWSNMARVHREVRAYCKSRPNTICMTP